MAILNADIPYFRCFVKRSYYTHNPNHENIYDEAEAYAIQSMREKIITFHVMFDFGMNRSRVPLSSLYWKKPDRDIEPHLKQLWNCFSENVCVHEYSYLTGKRCEVVLKDRSKVWATYMFTVDWYDNPYSNDPAFNKNAHIVFADDGYLLAQPNNRIFFKDMNWITKDFPVPLHEIKTDTEIINVETFSDRWISDDNDNFYYDINKSR